MVLSSFWEYDFFPLITHVACELITVTVRQEASALVHPLYISPSLQPVLLPVAFGASSSFCRTRCGRSCWTCAHQSRWEAHKDVASEGQDQVTWQAHMKPSARERKCEQIQVLPSMWTVSEVMLQSQCHQCSLTQAKETLLMFFVTAGKS